MINGTGIETTKTATSGFLQLISSHLMKFQLPQKMFYNNEENIRRMNHEANKRREIEKKEHEKKRIIEVKCVEMEIVLEYEGYNEKEVERRITEYRNKLLAEMKNMINEEIEKMEVQDSKELAWNEFQNALKMRETLKANCDDVYTKIEPSRKKCKE